MWGLIQCWQTIVRRGKGCFKHIVDEGSHVPKLLFESISHEQYVVYTIVPIMLVYFKKIRKYPVLICFSVAIHLIHSHIFHNRFTGTGTLICQ